MGLILFEEPHSQISKSVDSKNSFKVNFVHRSQLVAVGF